MNKYKEYKEVIILISISFIKILFLSLKLFNFCSTQLHILLMLRGQI